MTPIVLAAGATATTPAMAHHRPTEHVAEASSSPFSFQRLPVGPNGQPIVPSRHADTPISALAQTPASRNLTPGTGPRSYQSHAGSLALWNPQASTPQNQLAPSRLAGLTPGGGHGLLLQSSIDRVSRLENEKRAEEAESRLRQMREETEASHRPLHDLLMGDAYEKLLER